jgi:hypothetical protein
MVENQAHDPKDIPSADTMRAVLDNEIFALSKAMDLRLRELTSMVTAYTAGELTPEQMNERYQRYTRRWDEALPGIINARGMTDEEIIAGIDGLPKAFDRVLKGKERGPRPPSR